MPASEAHLDAPRARRRVVYPGFNDHVGGVTFADGVGLSGMAEGVLARLLGIGLPLVDLGPWEDAPAPAPVAVEPPAFVEATTTPPVVPQPIQPAPVGNRSDRRR